MEQEIIFTLPATTLGFEPYALVFNSQFQYHLVIVAQYHSHCVTLILFNSDILPYLSVLFPPLCISAGIHCSFIFSSFICAT